VDCPLPIFVAGLDFQNGRFGNQKPQGKLGEGKLIPPKGKCDKIGVSWGVDRPPPIFVAGI